MRERIARKRDGNWRVDRGRRRRRAGGWARPIGFRVGIVQWFCTARGRREARAYQHGHLEALLDGKRHF